MRLQPLERCGGFFSPLLTSKPSCTTIDDVLPEMARLFRDLAFFDPVNDYAARPVDEAEGEVEVRKQEYLSAFL